MATRGKGKSQKAPKAPQGAAFDVITPPNVLKVKVGGTSQVFDDDAVARAEAGLRALAGNFAAWMNDDVERLRAAFRALTQTSGDAAAREELRRAAYKLKGEAATLGLPLLGRVAASLGNVLSAATLPPRDLLEGHVVLIEALVKEGVAGEAGGLARADALEAAARALLSRQAPAAP